MKQKSAMERIDKLSEDHNRLRIAFWMLLAYVTILSIFVKIAIDQLWKVI